MFLLWYQVMISQVGINTTNPQAILDIQSQGNTDQTSALIIRDNLGQPIFNIFNDGSISTKGTVKTPALLDLRSDDGNDIIAIGSSYLTYSDAKPGALMYNPATKSMYLSDNTQWKELSYNYLKAFVDGDMTSANQTFPSNSSIETIVDWNIVSDATNSFDIPNKQFVAKRSSLYAVSVNISFISGQVIANSYIEAILKASNGRSVKCLTTYQTSTSSSIPTGVQCAGNFELTAGQSIQISLIQTTGYSKTINEEYCSMSIIEL